MAVAGLQGTVGALVTEFFSDSTSNQRKREIECQLSELNQQDGSWRQWLHFVQTHTQSEELLAFAFSALQDAISGGRLDALSRSQLRTDLQYLLMTAQLSGQQKSAYVRNKIAKLLVNLGFIDWPRNDSEFFEHIQQLCLVAETQSLGFLMLQTVSDELSTPRESPHNPRIEDLRRRVTEELQKVWLVLADLLKRGPGGGEVVYEAFRCTESLLSWVPLRSVDPKVVDALCCCAAAVMTSANVHSEEDKVLEMGILSLDCLCGALESVLAPTAGRECLEVLQQFVIGVLQATVPPEAPGSTFSIYLDRLADFLRLVMKCWLPFLDVDDQGNMDPGLSQVLSLLFNRTFQENDPERYSMYMEMWGTVLSRIVRPHAKKGQEHRELVGALVDQLLLRCCQSWISTDAESLLEPQLDLLHKAGRLFPEDACAKVLGLLEPELNHFQSPQVTTAIERVYHLGKLLKALGHVAPRLGHSLALEVALRLCQAASHGHLLLQSADKAWVDDIAYVQVQLLTSLNHLTLFVGSKQAPSELLLNNALAHILEPCPEKVCEAGCGLLLTVCRDIRPAQVFSVPSMQRLYEHLCQGTLRPLSPQCEEMVVQSVHAALCLQWSGTPNAAQCWSQREVAENNLVNALAQPLLRREPPGPAVERSLTLLQAMVDVLDSKGSQGRQIACSGLAPLWPLLLERLPASLRGGSEDPVLDLLETAVRVLAAQLGADRLEPLLALVEQRVSQEQCEEGEVASIEWLMSLLRPLLREPSLTRFFPVVLRLCLDKIQPRLIQDPGLTPMLGPRLLDLLEQCLANNWRYYFPGGVAAPEDLHNSHEFGRILSVFGWFLQLPEPDVVRLSIKSLRTFNRRNRLFKKVVFRESMMARFVEAVLGCLVSSPVRDLLRDEFQALLFELAEVDFDNFYGRLLPALVPPQELKWLKQERDLFGFNREFERLVGYLRRAAG